MGLIEPLRQVLTPGGENALLRLLARPQSSAPPAVDDPTLAQVSEDMVSSAQAGEVYDTSMRLLWCSPELIALLGVADDDPRVGIGEHVLQRLNNPLWTRMITYETLHALAMEDIAAMAYHCRKDAELHATDELLSALGTVTPEPAPAVRTQQLHVLQTVGDTTLPALSIRCVTARVHDPNGKLVGFRRVYEPGLRSGLLSMVSRGDPAMFERMADLFVPGQHAVALLFCDLADSTGTSRSMSSSAYFALLSRWSRAVDDAAVRCGGIVGKHVGDGVSVFFVLDHFDDEETCAAAALNAARQIAAATAALDALVSEQTGFSPGLSVNVGLHWGGTLYMGQIVTGGRLEVTAFGDEVNEAARLEAAATGGQVLASKQLAERIPDAVLGIESARLRYLALEDISPGVSSQMAHLPVCDLTDVV